MALRFPYWNGSALVEAETGPCFVIKLICGSETHSLLAIRRSDALTNLSNLVESFTRRDPAIQPMDAALLANQIAHGPRIDVRASHGVVTIGQRLAQPSRILTQDARHALWADLMYQYITQIQLFIGGPSGASWEQAWYWSSWFRGVFVPLSYPTREVPIGHAERLNYPGNTFGIPLNTADIQHAWVTPFIANRAGLPDHLVIRASGYEQPALFMVSVPDGMSYGVTMVCRPFPAAPSAWVITNTGVMQHPVSGQSVLQTALLPNPLELLLIYPEGSNIQPGVHIISNWLWITDIVIPSTPITYDSLLSVPGRRQLLGVPFWGPAPGGLTDDAYLRKLSLGSPWSATGVDFPTLPPIPGVVTELQAAFGVGEAAPPRLTQLIGDFSGMIADCVIVSRWGGAERWEAEVTSASWDGPTRTLTITSKSVAIVLDNVGPTLTEGMRLKGRVWSGDRNALAITITDNTIAGQPAEELTFVNSLRYWKDMYDLQYDAFNLLPDFGDTKINDMELDTMSALARIGTFRFSKWISGQPVVHRQPLPDVVTSTPLELWGLKIRSGHVCFYNFSSLAQDSQESLPASLGSILTWYYQVHPSAPYTVADRWNYWEETEKALRSLEGALALSPYDPTTCGFPWIASERHEADWEVEHLFNRVTLLCDPRLCWNSDDARKVLYTQMSLNATRPVLEAVWQVVRHTAYRFIQNSPSPVTTYRIPRDPDPLIARGAAAPANVRCYHKVDDELLKQYVRGWPNRLLEAGDPGYM